MRYKETSYNKTPKRDERNEARHGHQPRQGVDERGPSLYGKTEKRPWRQIHGTPLGALTGHEQLPEEPPADDLDQPRPRRDLG